MTMLTNDGKTNIEDHHAVNAGCMKTIYEKIAEGKETIAQKLICSNYDYTMGTLRVDMTDDERGAFRTLGIEKQMNELGKLHRKANLVAFQEEDSSSAFKRIEDKANGYVPPEVQRPLGKKTGI